jgi:outer membrane immunogenic protein
MKRLVLAALFAVGLVSTAAAQGAAPATAPSPFNGLYLGGNAIGAWGRDVATVSPPPAGPFSLNHAITGGMGGIQAGVNVARNKVIFGVEGVVDYGNINGSSVPPACGAATCSTKVPWLAAVTGRIGYADAKKAIYAKGGVAVVGIEFSATTTPTDRLNLTATGWTAGAGFEMLWQDKATVFIEYDVYRFGSASGTTSPVGRSVTTNVSFDTIKVGVNFPIGR